HAKQGASYGHTKIAGKQILRKGLSPLVTTISTATSAPVITGALVAVLIVVTNGDRPLRRICLPAILVCP
ncbi:hypothetical protein, partial [Mycolicibacterium goodii]|uniref:hypothetical protein n=1 Tax=Mycolicibacterium goodii TaxID=134601 RepID=UPI001BDD7CA2